MAVSTVTDLQPYKEGWSCHATNADLSGCEIIKAKSSTATESLYLKSVFISAAAAASITLGAGKTASAVTSTILGPIYMAANTSVSYTFTRPIKLAANTDLVADASGAGAFTVLVEGFTQ